MTTLQIVGNVLTGIGMFLFFLSSFLKNKNKIVLLQTGNHALSSIGEICLTQYSGSIQDAVSVVRNICILFKKNTKISNIIFILLGLGLGILGIILNVFVFKSIEASKIWLEILPIFASLQYSIVILLPNIKVPYIKASMSVSCVCWTIYGLFLKNYSMVVSNIIIFLVAIISLILYFIQLKKQKQSVPQEEQPLDTSPKEAEQDSF